MRGTWARHPRCIALRGEIGHRVSCAIYAQRPAACRELAMSWQSGEPNPQCDKARIAYGLAPLTREEVARALADS